MDDLAVALISLVVALGGFTALGWVITRPKRLAVENRRMRQLLNAVFLAVKDNKDIDPTSGLVYGLLESAGYQAPALKKEDDS